MPPITITQEVDDFFKDKNRLRRMEESEIHHDRPALAGVVKELEHYRPIEQTLAKAHIKGGLKESLQLRRAIGLRVRKIMEARGWEKAVCLNGKDRKGPLGIRAEKNPLEPTQHHHNSSGLALWFSSAQHYVSR